MTGSGRSSGNGQRHEGSLCNLSIPTDNVIPDARSFRQYAVLIPNWVVAAEAAWHPVGYFWILIYCGKDDAGQDASVCSTVQQQWGNPRAGLLGMLLLPSETLSVSARKVLRTILYCRATSRTS